MRVPTRVLGPLFLALLGLSGCSNSEASQATLTIDLALIAPRGQGPNWANDEICTGTGQADEFGPGLEVTIRDEGNELIGLATAERVRSEELERWVQNEIALEDSGFDSDFRSSTCLLTAYVDLVGGSSFYTVHLDGFGAQGTYSRADLEEADWTIGVAVSQEDAKY